MNKGIVSACDSIYHVPFDSYLRAIMHLPIVHKRLAQISLICAVVSLVLSACDSTSNDETNEKNVLSDGLLAYYPFNGNAVDDTGNGHNGIVAGATLVNDRFANPRRAYHFDGLDDQITFERSNSLKIQLPVSLSYWVKLDQVERTTAAFTTDFNILDNTGVFATFDSNGANPSFSFGNGGQLGGNSRRTKHGQSKLQPGIWYHIAGVIKGPDDITVYLNGEDDGGRYDGGASELAYSNGPSAAGIRNATPRAPSIFFEGTIDELAIYGIALTPEDIQHLYNN